jgi:alcohol dehydrogenase (cytochrome c)
LGPTVKRNVLTGAPHIVNRFVIVAMAGAEFGARGCPEACNPETALGGALYVPRRASPARTPGWTMPQMPAAAAPGPPAPMTDLDLVFWGIGNPAPWNPQLRNGDNLYRRGAPEDGRVGLAPSGAT